MRKRSSAQVPQRKVNRAPRANEPERAMTYLVILQNALQWVLSGLVALLTICTDPVPHIRAAWHGLFSRNRNPVGESKIALLTRLKSARSYDEWLEAAQRYDEYSGAAEWREGRESKLYDVHMIEGKLQYLNTASIVHETLIHELRTGLLRNLGGIQNPKLYKESTVGTKKLIEQYTEAVCNKLEYVERDSLYQADAEKFLFFYETRQAYGRSALLLSGGAGNGLYHLGVIKALFERDLLPKVISGSSVGSIIAAMCCIKNHENFTDIFNVDNWNLEAFAVISPRGSFKRRFLRFLDKGAFLDIKILKRCIRANLGDLTFYEAYTISGRILNITVTSSGPHERPRLLNYLTAPNVLIWSACTASCALPGVYAPVKLKAKDKDGKVIPYIPSSLKQKWSDGSLGSDLPMERLTHLFNVNHFIVSQVNPFILPYLNVKFLLRQTSGPLGTILSTLAYLCTSEVRHRLNQLHSLGLIPRRLHTVVTLIAQKYEGDITIVPPFSLLDFYSLFKNPTHERIEKCIRIGEAITWPKLSLIQNHCKIENTLERCVEHLRHRLYPEEEAARTATVSWARTPSYVFLQEHVQTRMPLAEVLAGGDQPGESGAEL
jgi:predicted acylesterase/phospholipase RssA